MKTFPLALPEEALVKQQTERDVLLEMRNNEQVVNLVDNFEHGGNVYLLIEYPKGQTMRSFLKSLNLTSLFEEEVRGFLD